MIEQVKSDQHQRLEKDRKVVDEFTKKYKELEKKHKKLAEAHFENRRNQKKKFEGVKAEN